MLELIGPDYLIAHCVEAFNAEQAEAQYRAYVTDALKAITENTSKYLLYKKNGAEFVEVGGKMTKRWAEIFRPPEPVDDANDNAEDNRTVEEIVDKIWGAIEGGGTR